MSVGFAARAWVTRVFSSKHRFPKYGAVTHSTMWSLSWLGRTVVGGMDRSRYSAHFVRAGFYWGEGGGGRRIYCCCVFLFTLAADSGPARGDEMTVSRSFMFSRCEHSSYCFDVNCDAFYGAFLDLLATTCLEVLHSYFRGSSIY